MSASTSPRRVALIGCYDSELPDLDGFEKWLVNDCYRHLGDEDEEGRGWGDLPDRIFELHLPEHRPWRSEEHWVYLHKNADKVWSFTRKPPLPPDCNLYPIADILTWHPSYFANSVAWMLALALHEGATEVKLLRLRFATFHERMLEKPCVEFWLGYLMAKGVKVTVEAGSGLLSTPYGLYGLSNTADAHAALYDEWQIDSDYRERLRNL